MSGSDTMGVKDSCTLREYIKGLSKWWAWGFKSLRALNPSPHVYLLAGPFCLLGLEMGCMAKMLLGPAKSKCLRSRPRSSATSCLELSSLQGSHTVLSHLQDSGTRQSKEALNEQI